MKITTDKAFKKFLEYYNRAVKNKVIDKPISWSLYQTWKWSDKKEKPRIKVEKEESHGRTN